MPAASADDILARFVAHATAQGLTLYPAQEEAVLELLGGKHVVLATPTGSGKSLVATALGMKAEAEGRTFFYTCPVKALVNEKFFDLCRTFGADKVALMTGDASVNRGAPMVCCTAEILANLALREGRSPADYVVMDEFHYYGDRDRGAAWQIPLIALRETTFLLMSATLGDMTAIAGALGTYTGREVAVVRGMQRPVPLEFEYRDTPLHETIADLVKLARHPIYVVNFTQRGAAEQAQNLLSVDFCSKDEKEAIRAAIGDFKFDTPYGKDVQRLVRHGLGLHHAGLLPKYRRLCERLAQAGHLKIVSGTDTLGVGVNIPIRTVVLTQLSKFDGEKTGILSAREFNQIAGRAGRKGFDDRGWVVAQAPEHVIENRRLSQKAAAGKKVTMRSPPQKGYVHFDQGTFDRLVAAQPEPLESRFEVTHGLLLAVLHSSPRGYRRLLDLIARSHGSDHVRRRHKLAAAQRFRTLRRAGIIRLDLVETSRAPIVVVNTDLQHDFSLNHTLSLYLHDTLPKLDRAAPSFALDVLTLVESILENPDAVLRTQRDRARDEAMAAMKAAGMEYEQRMEELEKIEWPKPLRDFIYDTFNAFTDKHPWVGTENIQPKSVARDLVERNLGFNEYVREYGLMRSEGVLLRYLSDAYKTLVQSVPESYRTDEVDDVIATLRHLLRRVDSSLVDEWERLVDPAAALAAAARGAEAPTPAPPPDPLADPRALAARIRAELHALVGAIARKDWEAAATLVSQPADAEPWPPERFATQTVPFFAEHRAVLATPAARRPHMTQITPDGPRAYLARQRLLSPDVPEEDCDWMIEARVDLAAPRNPDAPLVALIRIGT